MAQPVQSVSIGETSITHGMRNVSEVEQRLTTSQSPNLFTRSHLNAMGQAVQVYFPLTQDTFRLSPERSNEPDEEIMNNIGTNTSNVVTEPAVGILRTPHTEATNQTSIPTVEVLIPPGMGGNTSIPHVSLSISGYEPDSLRTLGIRSPPARIQEVSMMPQLDGPRSLPTRDPTRGEWIGFLVKQNKTPPKEAHTYIHKVTAIRRRNTLKKEMIMMGRGGQIKTKDPMIEEDTLVEDPLTEEDLLEEDTLVVEDPW